MDQMGDSALKKKPDVQMKGLRSRDLNPRPHYQTFIKNATSIQSLRSVLFLNKLIWCSRGPRAVGTIMPMGQMTTRSDKPVKNLP